PPVVNTGGSGTWTFKSSTYTAASFNNTSTQISALNTSSPNTANSIISVFFNTSSLPTSTGTYTVADHQNAGVPNAVSISLTVNGPIIPITYWMTGGNGTQTVY